MATITATMRAISNAFGGTLVSWEIPAGDWDRLRLVRNNAGTPLDEIEGDVLFTDVAGAARVFWQDTDLTQGRYYYYALFTRRGLPGGLEDWERVADAHALVTKDHGYTRKLYDSLPEWVGSNDYQSVGAADQEEEQTFLYRFLSIFGFELDESRTEIDSLLKLRDARLVSQTMLPALAYQVGVDYEPELGSAALRRFTANAIRLWGLKGTLPGVRELANVVMGYGAHARVGRNLVLDGLDAGPTTDRGRWRITGGTTAYRARRVDDVLPVDVQGVRVFTPAAASVTGTTRTGADEFAWMQYAIPIITGLPYTVSQYFRAPTGGSVSTTLTWLDDTGTPLVTLTSPALTAGTGWVRPYVGAVAPAGARYLEPGFTLTGGQANAPLEHVGVLVTETNDLQDWQCARELLLYLDPLLVNWVGNTSAGGGTAVGWSDDVQAAVSNVHGSYLTRAVADPGDEDVVDMVEAFIVEVPGDQPPAPVDLVDALGETVSFYTPSRQLIESRESWTSMVEVIQPADDPDDLVRTARVGFRLYDGPDFVGYIWSQSVVLNKNTFTPLVQELVVPDNAPYDRIEFAVSTDGVSGFRRAALISGPQRLAFFFDGSSPSETGDFLWEGDAFQSPTYYYPRRAGRASRLRALLADYIPHGSCFDLRFAVRDIPDTPRAVAGTDYDPLQVPTPTVGTRLRLRWGVLARDSFRPYFTQNY